MDADARRDVPVGAKGPSSDKARQRILRGSLPREVARFGLPLALGMGLQTTFNLVDAYIIARLEPEVASAAIGAIGICDPLAAIGTILSYGLSVASGAMLSRRRGEGDEAGVRRVAWQSLLLVVGLSLIFGLFGAFGAKTMIFDVVSAKGAVARLSVPYLRLMVGGSFSIFLLLHLTTIQRALGSSKTPIAILLTANALNLVLAAVMVYGPGEAPPAFSWSPPLASLLHIPRLELMGAAWATILSRMVVLLPTVWLVARRFGLFDRASRHLPDLETLHDIWRLGWPTSIQLVVRIAALLLTHSLVARAYTTQANQTATTALGVVFRLETMALFIGLGWGSGAQTFIGQNLGANLVERAKRSGYYCALYNAIMMAGLATLYWIFGAEVVRFFDDQPEVVDTASAYLRDVAPSYVGLGIGIVLGSAIQGAGATRQTLMIDLGVILCIQLPASLVVVYGYRAPTGTLWNALAFTYLSYAVVYGVSYYRGRYLRTAV